MVKMSVRRLPPTILVFCLIALGLSSCLAHHIPIVRKGGNTTQTLLVANQESLLDIVARQYNAVHNFSATVDMAPALGSAEKNKITEYKDVRAFILFRKPSDIRIVGLLPLVRNTAFDMVSDGTDFRLYIPSRNRFLVGRNTLDPPSANKLENLRPQHFLDALMVRPIDSGASKVMLENLTDEDDAYYILHEIQQNDGGNLTLLRTIWFSRLDLRLSRQLIFDPGGNILTDARYSEWRPYDNVPFPKHVEINRPRDEYGVVIDVVKMDINRGVADERFVLQQPEGTTVQTVGQPPAAAPEKPAPPPRPPPRKKR
jgi:hypothetical protein